VTLEDDFKSLVQDTTFKKVLSTNRQAAMKALIVVSGQSSVLTDSERSVCENW